VGLDKFPQTYEIDPSKVNSEELEELGI